MEIGDYYNFKNIEGKGILSKQEDNGYENQYFKKEEVKWVVFDKKEDGEILLITEKPLEQNLYLKGKISYERRNRRNG